MEKKFKEIIIKTDKLSVNEKFKCLKNKVEKNKTKINYNNFILFLKCIYIKYFFSKEYEISITITDDDKNVMFNSDSPEFNTYDNYVNKNIGFTNNFIYEVSEIAERKHKAIKHNVEKVSNFSLKKTSIYSKKIGSCIVTYVSHVGDVNYGS